MDLWQFQPSKYIRLVYGSALLAWHITLVFWIYFPLQMWKLTGGYWRVRWMSISAWHLSCCGDRSMHVLLKHVYFGYNITVRENSVSKLWSSQPCGNPKLYTPTQPQPPQSPTLKMMFIIAWQLNYPVVRANAPSSVQNRSRPTSAGVGGSDNMNRHEEWFPTMFVVMVSYHVCCNYNDSECLIVIMITNIITIWF